MINILEILHYFPFAELIMIYTTSCRDKDYADLKPLLERLDARYIDIRFAPSDKPVQWSKAYLQLLLKRSYRHFSVLGLREILPGNSAIQNLMLGLKILGEKRFNAVLLCDCADPIAVIAKSSRASTQDSAEKLLR